MPPSTFITNSEDETIAVGRQIAAQLSPPALVFLIGDLGSGKTTLAKGIVSGLGAALVEEVSSPTFTLIHEYGRQPKVYHIDLYRLDQAPDLDSLGLDDLWDEDAIVLIEWPEKFSERFPAEHLEIHLDYVSEQDRRITLGCGASSPACEPAF